MKTRLPDKIRILPLHLARGEYGSELMRAVAREALDNGEAEVVHVHEHGGWWLQFAAGPTGAPLIVGTANDAAVLSLESRLLLEALNRRELVWLPERSRGDVTRRAGLNFCNATNREEI